MQLIPGDRPAALGIIGLGNWGKQVALSAEPMPDLNIVACYARTPQTRLEFAERFGCRPCSSYLEMLRNTSIDGILIMTPNRAHREQVVAAAAHGKHVLVDKPISSSMTDGVAIVRACEAADVVLAVGHQSRREKPLRRLKELLAAGELGMPVMVEGNYSHGAGLHLTSADWRWSHEECPGGSLIQIGIHLIDTLHYLFGPITRVHSWQRRALAEADIDDVTCTLLEFASGLLGYLGSTYASSFSHWLRVYGTEKNAHYDQLVGLTMSQDAWDTGPVRATEAPAAQVKAPIPTVQEELDEFVTCMRTGGHPEVDGKLALRSVAVVLAAVESAKVGQPMLVDELMRREGALI
jgi:predicted dehydrogenase